MSSQLPIPPPGFDELSREEQMEYVEDLLTYMSSRGEDFVEVPEWHRQILEERVARYGPGFDEGTSWEEFEKELIKDLTHK